jgi:GDPmannose 4,6-dehydratase
LRILEAVWILGLEKTRVYQASTSELYGGLAEKNAAGFMTKAPFLPTFSVWSG